jgi:hypothetical protein
LDLFYFNQLLNGAIQAVLNIEKAAQEKGWKHLNFSTTIKKVVERERGWEHTFRQNILVFYCTVFFSLVGYGLLILWLARP